MASTRVVGKNARLYIGDRAIYLKMFEMENVVEFNFDDSTPYAVDWREQELIDGTVGMSVNAFLDKERPVTLEEEVTDTAYWDSFQNGGVFKADPAVPITFIPGNTALAGDPCRFFDAVLGTVAMSTPRSEIGRLRGRFNASGRYCKGLILCCIEQSFPTGDTFFPAVDSGQDLGAAGLIGAAAILHVYKKSPVVQTFTVTVRDSAVLGSGYATAVAFTAFTDRTSEYKEDIVDGGKQYHQVQVNNGGTAETLGIVVASTNF